MGTGTIRLTADNRIVWCCPDVINVVGNLAGLLGNEVVRTKTLVTPTLATGLEMLAWVRQTGKTCYFNYWLVGPRGTVFVIENILKYDDVSQQFYANLTWRRGGFLAGMQIPNLPEACVTAPINAARTETPVVTISQSIDDFAKDMNRRGAAQGSIKRFTDIVRSCAVHGEWTTVLDATLESAEKFLGFKRENGWSGTTHDQGCSALRCFGKFLAKRKWVPASPFEHLESSGEQGGTGARAARTEEVRAMIAETIKRQQSGRMKGNTPAFFAFLCLTGLRHDEAASCRWKDLVLDADAPCLWSDPKWAKNGKRQRVMLNDEIVMVLNWHRTTVRCGIDDPVFPVVPNRHTWGSFRESAKIDAEDQQGKGFTYHSCRKWFATELDRAGASPGVVSRLLRHSDTLAQSRYIDPDPAEEVKAVQRLPLIWPESQKNILMKFVKSCCNPAEKPNNENVKPLSTQDDSLTPGSGAGGLASHTTPDASARGQVVVTGGFTAPMHGNGQSRATNESRASESRWVEVGDLDSFQTGTPSHLGGCPEPCDVHAGIAVATAGQPSADMGGVSGINRGGYMPSAPAGIQPGHGSFHSTSITGWGLEGVACELQGGSQEQVGHVQAQAGSYPVRDRAGATRPGEGFGHRGSPERLVSGSGAFGVLQLRQDQGREDHHQAGREAKRPESQPRGVAQELTGNLLPGPATKAVAPHSVRLKAGGMDFNQRASRESTLGLSSDGHVKSEVFTGSLGASEAPASFSTRRRSGSTSTDATSHHLAGINLGGVDFSPQDADALATRCPSGGGIDDLAHDLCVAKTLKTERIRKMVVTTIAAMLMGAAVIPPYQVACDGKCCYEQAGCWTYQLIADRLKCCEESCWGATYLGCVDAAIGSSEMDAIAMLAEAATVIENWNPVYQASGQYADALYYFKRCAESNVERVRTVARVRASDSTLLTALLPHTEQGGI